MGATYLWTGSEVLVVKEQLYRGNADAYRGMLAVDTFCVSPPQRYGRFNAEAPSIGSWRHVPVEDFPPEFRATLLLLGVH